MIKIKPQLYSNIAKMSQNQSNHIKPQTKIDLSGEEYGYFKIGDRIIKTIFPR